MDIRLVLFWGSYVVIVIAVIAIVIHAHVTGKKKFKNDSNFWIGFLLGMCPIINHGAALFVLLVILGD